MKGRTTGKEEGQMDQDKVASSPFSALSYQEQQDRWLEWRSRQLDYQPASGKQTAKPPEAQREEGLPRMRLPNMRIAAPARHRELDEVLSRHQKALRQAGAFQTTAID